MFHHIKYTKYIEGLTVDDILDLTPKFWAMHKNPIILSDIGAHAMLSIQHNLVAGTIAPFVYDHPELQKTLHKVMSFQVS